MNILHLPFRQFLMTLLLVLISGVSAYSQESEGHEGEHHEEGRNILGVTLGHSLVIEGVKDGERRSIYVPSFAIQYYYKLSERWILGTNIDALIETFVIEKPDGVEIERERPVATVLMGGYEISEHFGLFLGGGVEWEKSENFGMMRFGGEYGHPLGDNGFEFLVGLGADILFGGYNTINIGVGVAKTF